ncbi:hypothetical protein OsJ_22725 [Oryza sativa Japonica Group]|uniref:Uncharacterized protein n=1 Tax=Oryza sativa subsp. japonica TaxID=39947 RepID=B9FQZ8_ORYSJ|nr:hypothetical protein OsJ_22725 [Oryza sativa Japonica Group]
MKAASSIFTALSAAVFGFFIGISFPVEITPKDVASGKQYLVTLTVGYTEKDNINATVHKLSDKFDIVLFHYDGRTTEWEEFEWSKKVVHVSAKKQTKWWFAKRFMHPSIVAPYEYIFLWDEDLGVDNFSAEEYISIARKHGLGISQPGLDATKGKRSRYTATARRPAGDMHTSGRFVEVRSRQFDEMRTFYRRIADAEKAQADATAAAADHHR